jgi:hypothetical protein
MYATVRFAGTWARQKDNREIFKIEGGDFRPLLSTINAKIFNAIFNVRFEIFERFEIGSSRKRARRDKEKSSKPLENKGF